MNVATLFSDLHHEFRSRAYFLRLDVLDQSRTMLKARLHISPDLFVQVYRNDRFETTNFVLIYGGRRLYGRDQLGGVWHRHRVADPEAHDSSPEGRRSVELSEFLDEVESVLATLGLP